MRHALWLRVAVVMPVAIHVLLSAACAAKAPSLVANGDFKNWTDGLPDGWEVTIGARNGGDEPKSKVALIKGPALMLRGDANTMAWHSVSQVFPVRTGENYYLNFETRTKDIKREAGQFNNCYVGVLSFDGAEKVVARKFDDVSANTTGWTKHRIEFRVPQDAASTKVVIFLSKSGVLAVKNISVTAAAETSGSPTESATPIKADPEALVTNGNFKDWSGGRPDGWTIGIGARNGGNEPKSEIEPLSDAGIALRGNASTMAWHSIGQELDLEKGKTYTLAFEAQAEDVRRQGRQFNNCYVGVMIFDAAGRKVDTSLEDISRVGRWKKHRIDFRVPGNAEKTELLIFLSKSGTLMVKNVSVKEATPDRSFRRSRR